MRTRRSVLRIVSGIAGSAGLVSTTSTATVPDDEHVMRFDADPENEYYYPYFLRVPYRTPDGEIPLMVAPNNTCTTSDDYDEHLESALEQAVNGSGEHLARELGIPVLVPATG